MENLQVIFYGEDDSVIPAEETVELHIVSDPSGEASREIKGI